MGRKRKQFPTYEEPDAKLARADSEGDLSENGTPWGLVVSVGVMLSQLPPGNIWVAKFSQPLLVTGQ
jgi:hypothetical protein